MSQPSTFAFEAQTIDGKTIDGTINSPAITEASSLLATMQLRVTRLEPSEQRSVRSEPGGEPQREIAEQRN
jgi:type II secretory pathway component PulF